MADEVKLPRLGQGMESGTIVRWLKSAGDEVEKGEPLYELDTDKVTQEVEADFSGVLLKINVAEGEAAVGTTIAVIGEPREEVSDVDGGAAGEVDARAAARVAESEQAEGAPGRAREPERERERGREASPPEQITEIRESAEPAGVDGAGARIKASPLARRIARERGVELGSLRGTGPEGRVVAEDVERAAAAGPAQAPAAAPTPTAAPAPGHAPPLAAPPGEVERLELTPLRRTIARRLTEAWQAPAFQIAMSADMTRAQELHTRLTEAVREGEPKPTITDILTRACAAGLMRHRAVNALWAEDAIELHPSANVGIAVAVEGGLVVPVIHEAEQMTIAALAAARTDIVTRARAGKLRAADLDGGTFTISNLGMFGVDQFVAVLNPPQAAVLAVGAIESKALPVDGGFEARPLMTMTLTCDHRSLDGATAADFLRTVKAFLEEPGLML